MKKSKKATSIIEAMIVLLIITTWVVWMYNIFSKSNNLSNSTENKIYAIQIAKQWIEWFTNIRNSNWIRFSSDYKNCWNTDITIPNPGDCLWDKTTDYDINLTNSNKRFIIDRDSNNSWFLTEKDSWTYWLWSYNTDFRIKIDSNWIYTHSWTINFLPVFTREINIKYLKDDWSEWDSNNPKMLVTSLVQWLDSSSNTPHKVELEETLTNRKK